MQRRISPLASLALLTAFSFAVGSGLVACADDGIACDVTWWSGQPDTSDMLGETSYSYGFGSVQKAVDQCAMDQEVDEDRPAGANGHSCDCETK